MSSTRRQSLALAGAALLGGVAGVAGGRFAWNAAEEEWGNPTRKDCKWWHGGREKVTTEGWTSQHGTWEKTTSYVKLPEECAREPQAINRTGDAHICHFFERG